MTSHLTTISGYPATITPVDHVEPVPRRIRAELGGHVVLDTTRALYLWEWPFYPQYHIPFEDIDPSAVLDEDQTHQLSRGTVATLGLRVGDTVRSSAGRRYLESVVPELVATVRFDWEALDAWYEEDEPVFVHARNPYVRVDALRSSRHVRVERDGILLAVSDYTSPQNGETAALEWVRYRTVGDLTITGAVRSTATDIARVITEISAATVSERGETRADDRTSAAAMEDRKREGYF